jgi:hypothetical protein
MDFMGASSATLLQGGVDEVAQVSTITYNRQGSTSSGVQWNIYILWYSLPDLEGNSHPFNYTMTSYVTGSDNETALGDGIVAALNATTYSNGVPFSNYATCSNNSGVVTITAIDKNRKFEVNSYVSSGNGNAVATFDNISNNIAKGTGLEIVTKDYDLGSPGVAKKFYKAYLTYKLSTGNTVYMQYAVNGIDTWYDFDNTVLATATSWTTLALKPATSSQANNIYSLKFRIKPSRYGGTIKGLEINDITAIYRVKSIK